MWRPPTWWRSPRSTGGFWTGTSVRQFDAALARKLEPLRDVGVDESRECLRRVRLGLRALLGKTLPRLGGAEHPPHIGADLRHDLARRARRGKQPEPAERGIVRKSGFGDGREI